MTSILTVCTGNICRSPAAELLLKEYMGDLTSSSSAGVHALCGSRMPAEMLMSLDAAGLDGRRHKARQLSPDIATEADLIIAMTAEHRTAIVRQTPAALRRTFIFDELVQASRGGAVLDGATAAARLLNLPRAIAAFRPHLADMHISDVPDPYRRNHDAYDATFRILKTGISEIDSWVRNA